MIKFLSYISKCYNIVLCYATMFRIAITKRRDEIVYIIAPPLGDTCYALAYRSFILKNGKPNFYISESNKLLIENCYKDVLENGIVTYYKKGTKLFKIFNNSLLNTNLNAIVSKFGVKIIFPYAYYKIDELIQENYFNILRNKIFPKIPPSFEIEYPLVPDIKIQSIQNFQEIKEKIIVLNPYSNSMLHEDEILWKELARYLCNIGYCVYTNVIKTQKEIENTLRLDCSILELYNICNQIPLFISIRSGIVDFTILSKCNKIVIWYSKDSIIGKSIENICNLDAWGVSNVHSIHYSNRESTMLQCKAIINKYIK